MKCLSYIHPLRLIHQMHLSDLGAENESDIRALVLKPTTLLPEPPATFRVDYFPFMMKRTLMVHPDGVTGCAAVAYTERPCRHTEHRGCWPSILVSPLSQQAYHSSPNHHCQAELQPNSFHNG